jgi:tetratricopeptide (TPR) repeat protein
MTELLPKPKPPSGSGADQSAHIRTLEVQLDYDPNNPSLHAELAWAYVNADRWNDAIESFQTCYKININNRDEVHAAKAAGEMGYCFLKRSQTARNSRPNKSQDWREGIGWKLRASRLYRKSCRINPSDSKTIKNYALNEDSIGYAYLRKANQSSENPEQAQKYWLKGMQLKKKAYTLFEKLSQTDPSTLENCAKTAGYIGEKYLKASKRLWEGNPEQAEKYWLEGMAWKEKAYGSYKELSDTDPSKEQDCALTAAQLGEEFAEKGIDYKAIEWYEKALQHNPDDESVNEAYETLVVQRELEIVRTLGLRTRFL